jgi:hypothetical protein
MLGAHRGDEEDWRIERLERVAKATVVIAEVLTGRIMSPGTIRLMHDHEGELTVVWARRSPRLEKAVQAAWRMECEGCIKHITEKDYLKRNS